MPTYVITIIVLVALLISILLVWLILITIRKNKLKRREERFHSVNPYGHHGHKIKRQEQPNYTVNPNNQPMPSNGSAQYYPDSANNKQGVDQGQPPANYPPRQ